MKSFQLIGLLAGALLLAGCADLADTVKDTLPNEGPPLLRTFPAEPRATYAAARAALDQIGFKFTHGGPAQGELRAVSEISPGDSPGSSHQFTLRAEFHPALDGSGTEVSLRLTEIVEADSTNHPGMGTETPLKDTAVAEVFFRTLQQNLGPAPAK
jgi:hypothetical protein